MKSIPGVKISFVKFTEAGELTMQRKNKVKVTPSSGTVFRDLGFSAED